MAELDAHIELERATLDRFFGFSDTAGTRDYGKPRFAFYDDRSNRIGARAIRGERDRANIYLGLQLIQDEIQGNPSTWQTTIIGTLAHEWAHALQYKSNMDERTFTWETHADFLAGWYIGVKQASGSTVAPEAFWRALFVRGNNQGYFSDNAYGSPQQRAQAMDAGRRYALSTHMPNHFPLVDDASDEGYKVVQRLRAGAR